MTSSVEAHSSASLHHKQQQQQKQKHCRHLHHLRCAQIYSCVWRQQLALLLPQAAPPCSSAATSGFQHQPPQLLPLLPPQLQLLLVLLPAAAVLWAVWVTAHLQLLLLLSLQDPGELRLPAAAAAAAAVWPRCLQQLPVPLFL
jgi:hypothetical protein